MAQISQPLAESDISAYYISTFSFDHALVGLDAAITLIIIKPEVERIDAFVRFESSVLQLTNFQASWTVQVPEEDISSVVDMLQDQRKEPATS